MMITTVMITLIWVFVNAKSNEEKRRVQMRQSTNFGLPETSRMVLYRCEPSKIRIRFVETVKFTFIDWFIRFILLEIFRWTDRRRRWEMFTDNDDERVEAMNKANPLGGGRSMELINAIDPVSNGRIRIEPIFIFSVEENHFDQDSLSSSVLEISKNKKFEITSQKNNWHYHFSILVFFSYRDEEESERRKDHLLLEVLQTPVCNTLEIYQIQLLFAHRVIIGWSNSRIRLVSYLIFWCECLCRCLSSRTSHWNICLRRRPQRKRMASINEWKWWIILSVVFFACAEDRDISFPSSSSSPSSQAPWLCLAIYFYSK